MVTAQIDYADVFVRIRPNACHNSVTKPGNPTHPSGSFFSSSLLSASDNPSTKLILFRRDVGRSTHSSSSPRINLRAGLSAAKSTSPQTWNRYAYVVNSPLSLTDPLGLWKNGSGDSDPCDDDCNCVSIDCPGGGYPTGGGTTIGGTNGQGGGGGAGNGSHCDAKCKLLLALQDALNALDNPDCSSLIDAGSGEAADTISSNIAMLNATDLPSEAAPFEGRDTMFASITMSQLAGQNGVRPPNAQTSGPTGTLDAGGVFIGFTSNVTINVAEGSEFVSGYNGRFGLDDRWNRAVTILHEMGHAMDFSDDALANGSNTHIIPDSMLLPNVSYNNSMFVANACFPQGN